MLIILHNISKVFLASLALREQGTVGKKLRKVQLGPAHIKKSYNGPECLRRRSAKGNCWRWRGVCCEVARRTFPDPSVCVYVCVTRGQVLPGSLGRIQRKQLSTCWGVFVCVWAA